jgi:hypothetical protein
LGTELAASGLELEESSLRARRDNADDFFLFMGQDY